MARPQKIKNYARRWNCRAPQRFCGQNPDRMHLHLARIGRLPHSTAKGGFLRPLQAPARYLQGRLEPLPHFDAREVKDRL